MRLFLRHVAPSLIGENSMRSCKQGTGRDYVSTQATELQTIGSKGTRNPYNRMEDDNATMGSEERAAAGWNSDQDSERGIVLPAGIGQIVKTDTIIIKSEIAEDRMSCKAGF